jgi:hypothetical protein
MSKNAMAGAVTLCGVGLCMIGGAMLMQNSQQAHAAVGSMPAAAAVAATASAQAGGEPAVVWYGIGNPSPNLATIDRLYRAWSDGTIEMKRVDWNGIPKFGYQLCEGGFRCASPWIVISSPTAGFRAAADINADEMVDGADLASVLSNWGDAPRVPFPPSDCPLNLINP